MGNNPACRRGKPAVLSWWLIQAFGIAGIIFLTISVMRIIRRRGPEIFSILTMVLSIIAIWPLLWFLGIGSVAFPADIKKTEPAVLVRSPFTERVLTGWGGDSLETNYHVVVPVERWAYDIIKLPASVGSPNLNDYGIYGLEIVSPVSGTVVQMRNDLPDHPPGDFPVKFRDMKGNFIYLKLDQSGDLPSAGSFHEGFNSRGRGVNMYQRGIFSGASVIRETAANPIFTFTTRRTIPLQTLSLPPGGCPCTSDRR